MTFKRAITLTRILTRIFEVHYLGMICLRIWNGLVLSKVDQCFSLAVDIVFNVYRRCQKVFDTVEYGILLNKRDYYGFKGPTYELLAARELYKQSVAVH